MAIYEYKKPSETPFGMVMEGRKYRDENYDYRYGFNGKEDDKDFGDKQLIQDYGFRLYNPVITRFLSVDPLAPSFPRYTPYRFAGNKVIIAIDLDGLEEWIVNDNKNNGTATISGGFENQAAAQSAFDEGNKKTYSHTNDGLVSKLSYGEYLALTHNFPFCT